jgi:hypothetical protein
MRSLKSNIKAKLKRIRKGRGKITRMKKRTLGRMT